MRHAVCQRQASLLFHLKAHYTSGQFLSELYSVISSAFRHNLWSAGNFPNPEPWHFEPKINKLRQTVEDYYCAVSSHNDQGFLFYRANIPHTNTQHTSWQSDRYICSGVLGHRHNKNWYYIYFSVSSRRWSLTNFSLSCSFYDTNFVDVFAYFWDDEKLVMGW